jgi:hypothetical protein
MRKSGWTPSMVHCEDQNVYLVVDDLGRLGRVWREALLGCWFQLREGDVRRMYRCCPGAAPALRFAAARRTSTTQDFVERHESRDLRQLTLLLV